MTDKPHRLIWIDTETTGISPRDGQLLEVAMMLTDMQGMERPANAIEDVHGGGSSATTPSASPRPPPTPSPSSTRATG